MKNLICVTIITLVSLFSTNGYSDQDYTVKAMNLHFVASNILEFDIYLSGNINYKGGQFIFNFNPAVANGGVLTFQKALGSRPTITDLPYEPQWRSSISGNQLKFFAMPFMGPVQIVDNGVGIRIVKVRLKTTASSFLGTFSDINLSWDVSSAGPLFRTKVFYSVFDDDEIESCFEANMQGNYIFQLGSNLISGNAFFDFNGNGIKDAGEVPLKNSVLSLSPSQGFASTDNSGNYNMYCGTGINNVSIQNLPAYFSANPVTTSVTFTGTGQSSPNNDFALQTTSPGINDLRISLANISMVRNGFDILYKIKYENIGTTLLSGNAEVLFDALLDYLPGLTNPTPSSFNSGTKTLTWNFSDLYPGESHSIVIGFNVPAETPLGSALSMTAKINPISGDNNPNDNESILNNIVIGSYDPNDISVSPAGNITPQQVTDAVPLTYTIRFQNTGTASAIKVRVADTLSPNMDLSSFEPVSASHDYSFYLSPDGIAEWTFNNIELPDSTTDEPSSHGFIQYRISPKNNLQTGDQIQNTAYIYFDFNEAVITNTVVTYVEPPVKFLDLKFRLEAMHPLPDSVQINLRSSVQPFQVVDSATVFSTLEGTHLRSVAEFENIIYGNSYYIELKHRNSIATWSASPIAITNETTIYDFTSSVSQAFGNNMILTDGAASIFSGDVDQDGLVEFSDILLVHNDVSSFATGYVNTDLNGDELVDISDLFTVYNNSVLFRKVIKP